jgi:hypothetical protein
MLDETIYLAIFWTITVIMTLAAFFTVLPWLKRSGGQKKHWISLPQVSIVVLVSVTLYSLYFYFGNPKELSEYYTIPNQELRKKQRSLRPLISTLSKEEVKIRLHLEAHPKDLLVQCKLLDVLAIQALILGKSELANRYWKEALAKLPETDEAKSLRTRIQELQKKLDLFY